MTHWASDYIGEPWVAGANDCWSFFRRVQAEQFARQLPAIDPATYHVADIARAYRDAPEVAEWTIVDHPREGDGVLMGKAKRPTHVGVWIEADGGGVLHCQEEGGVVFTSRRALAGLGWNVLGFYRKAK